MTAVLASLQVFFRYSDIGSADQRGLTLSFPSLLCCACAIVLSILRMWATEFPLQFRPQFWTIFTIPSTP